MKKTSKDAESPNAESDGLRETQLLRGRPHLDNKRERSKYGVNRHPKCDECGGSTRLTRREEHPVRGPKYELQTFTCVKCGHVQQRDAASPGAG